MSELKVESAKTTRHNCDKYYVFLNYLSNNVYTKT